MKMIKQQMFGRTNFNSLRTRVFHACKDASVFITKNKVRPNQLYQELGIAHYYLGSTRPSKLLTTLARSHILPVPDQGASSASCPSYRIS